MEVRRQGSAGAPPDRYRRKRARARAEQAERRQRREVSALRHALEREREESARLRQQLTELRRAQSAAPGAPRPSEPEARARAFADVAESAQLFQRRTYASFLVRSLSSASRFRWANAFMRVWRRLRTLRVVVTAVVFILTTTVLSAVYLVFLPLLLLATACALAAAGLRSRRMNRRMREALAGRRLRVIIPCTDAGWRDDSFLVREARASADAPRAAVIVVSPYTWSRRGLGGKGFFLTVRTEGRNLYLVRRHYYFLLRRRVLASLGGDQTVLYV